MFQIYLTKKHDVFVQRPKRGSFILDESKSNIAFRWVNREFNLMFALSSDKDQEKIRFTQCK